MATLETIRRIRVEASERGLPQLEASLGRYADTMEAIGVAAESTDRKVLSAAKGFENVQKRIDPTHREMAGLVRDFTALNRALEQGMGVNEYARNMEMLMSRTSAAREESARLARQQEEEAKASRKAAEAAKVLADSYEEVRREQNAMNAQARFSQHMGIRQPTPGAARASAAVFEEAFAQQDQMARSANALKASLDPVGYAAMKAMEQVDDYRKMLGAGVINQHEFTQAAAQTQARFENIRRDYQGLRGMTISQTTQLGYQLNDIISGVLMGQSPLTILAQQGGQVYQALADTPGGAAAGAKQLGQRLLGMITPARVALGGIAVMAVEAASAYSRFSSMQLETTAVMTSLGRFVGMTAEEFDGLARSAATAGNISTRSATTMGQALARTGRLGSEAIGDIISVSKDFARSIGEDTEDAQAKLVQLFSRPAEGMAQLQAQFRFLDAATERHIEHLIRMGDQQQAIRVFIEKWKPALADAEAVTGSLTSAWEKFKSVVSDVDMGIGRMIDNAVKGAAALNETRKQAGISFAPGAGGTPAGGQPREQFGPPQSLMSIAGAEGNIAGAANDLKRMSEGLKALGEGRLTLDLQNRADEVRKIANTYGDATKEARQWRDWEVLIGEALKSTNPLFRAQVGEITDLNRAREVIENRRRFDTQEAVQAEQREIDRLRATSMTREQDAVVRKRQESLNLSQQNIGVTQAQTQAQHEGNMVMAETDTMLRRMIQSQELSQAEIRKEIEVMGMATGEREIAMARLQAENELKNMGVNASSALAQAYIREREETARLNQERNAARLQSDLNFERDQLGRSELDQAVASRLRGAGLPQDHAIGAQIKLNEALKVGKDLAMDFGKGFAQDLRRGVDATEALTNALDRMGDRLLDMAMDMAISGIFKSITGGLTPGGGAGGFLSGLFGGGTTAATAHRGGIIGLEASGFRNIHPAHFNDAPRFHSGGLLPDEVPIVAKRGEGVFTREQMAAMGGGTTVIVNPVVENRAGAQVSQEVSTGPNGEVNIKTLIQKASADGAMTPGNPMNKAVRTMGRGTPLTNR